ncbi:IS21 family transposase [Chitinophaga sancti]|uniref:IS21 family transposase n=1 Tax=Chitinophaga sancti TaxID=1004 RepID=UPI002A761E99|nr:IS21 family transposase [Chitinophaga sancti]WPQ60151.1 IS21 family transposase [Chitinophaga sancti]
MLIVRRLIQLLQREFSMRNIAIELELNRETVSVYEKRIKATGKNHDELLELNDEELAAALQPRQASEEDPRLTDFMARKESFLNELGKRGVTRKLLLKEYRKVYPDCYGYTRFCGLLDEQIALKGVSMHHEHKAGEIIQIDFAGDKMSYVEPETGELIECVIFVAVLPFSGYTYVMALADATLPHLVKALNNCLLYFGGVSVYIKCDNMKQAVIKPCLYEPTLNEILEQWSVYNSTALLTARVRKPKDKPHVEQGVHLSYQRIFAPLRNDVFFSLKELNDAIWRELENHNHEPFQKKRFTRYERFIDGEKSKLSPLPQFPFVIRHRQQKLVAHNYHFHLTEDNHYYSVPYRFVGFKLTAIYDTTTVEIYNGSERIATHSRSPVAEGYTTETSHMPSNHQAFKKQKGWDSTYFLQEAGRIGSHVHAYMEALLKSRPQEQQAYNACRGLLSLAVKKQIGPQRLENACLRALNAGIVSYRTIKNMLANNMEKEELGVKSKLPSHQNLRGPEEYK